jgi:hypothetical protein
VTLSAHDPSIPPLPPAQTDWAVLLHDLDRRTRSSDPSSELPFTWALHAWANDHLDSAAIRVDGSEGLIGPAPARWRLLVHASPSPTPSPAAPSGFAVTVLDGRASLQATNVLASLLVAPGRPAIITVRGPCEPICFNESVRQGIADPSAALVALADLALGRCARVSGSAAAVPAALRLAAAFALSQRGGELTMSAPLRRGSRRPRAFVATGDPAAVRRQLSAVEAALRKRERTKR